MAERHAWWSSLRHGGVLIAPSRLAEFFPDDPAPMPRHLADRLRRDVTRADTGSAAVGALLDTVLEEVCGLGPTSGGSWLKASEVPATWSRKSVSGKAVKPRRLWVGPRGAVLPVFFTDETRVGVGRSRADVSHTVEWLRQGEHRVGLLTNGHQWQLLYAGLDFHAWAEWDTERWFEEGEPGDQVAALRVLLSRRALTPPSEKEQAPLLAAISASRKGQAELSAVLGERVRQAVERLIQSYGGQLAALPNVENAEIYRAASRVVMRLVVLLFAEARDLLPRDHAIYRDSYGVSGLLDSLERAGGGSASERLRHRSSAWPRLLALFRLVYEGSAHERMPIPRYGGGLFQSGGPDAADGIDRALAVFEDPAHGPNDEDVRWMLRRLCRTEVRVRAGRGATWVEAPVDFSDLSSEYIGILYEGLLDFELHRVAGGDTVVFLNLGDEPALPLTRLEQMDAKQLDQLVEKFKAKQKGPAADGGDGDDENEDEEESEDTEVDEEADEPASQPQVAADSGWADDQRRAAQARAEAWARRAAEAAKIVRKPKSAKGDAQREYDAKLNAAARSLVARVVLPGEWYLVRWGGTRKGSGTFYTRPGLAIPTVHRTLRPLAYVAPLGADRKPDDLAPPAAWTPRKPEEILALRVCDPAMGSGSFLVGALRFLTDALYRALHAHGRLAERSDRTVVTLAEGGEPTGALVEDLTCRRDADEFEERLRARLKRYIVERCVYGVDLDPLAVELARLALWVETMDRELGFEFLDHKLKVGNSLVGCWFDRFRDYPVMAWNREGGDANHGNGVHLPKGAWTKAIKAFKGRVATDVLDALNGQKRMFALPPGRSPEQIHDEVVTLLRRMHAIPVQDAEGRAAFYRDTVLTSDAFVHLREAFDTWCAVWFWPADKLEAAPVPTDMNAQAPGRPEVLAALRRQYRPFHWELEFPDVFAAAGAGFDAVLGNPPWDIQKPNSKEFFSGLDPIYRAYGKQAALKVQSAFFERDARHERDWLLHNAHFKAMSNWVSCATAPFGDPDDGGERFSLDRSAKKNEQAHRGWRNRRSKNAGYSDAEHPFRHQGSADLNLYKLFLEQAHALLRAGGRLAFIVPSGVYTHRGTTGLRRLFLERCDWQWLFGFENHDRIFDIHRSFKFGPIIVQKGGSTVAVRTSFMNRSLAAWEAPAPAGVLRVTRAQIERFSPHTGTILEVLHQRDIELLERMYSGGVLLGSEASTGWAVSHTAEFHLTNDSSLFDDRPVWEGRGYVRDAYGRWTGPAGEIALPLYEGRMVGAFDFSQKGWVTGKGRGARWREIPWGEKGLEPQYLMDAKHYRDVIEREQSKLCFMAVSSATNVRTMIAAIVGDFPCGNSTPVLATGASRLSLVSILNSFAYDFQLRRRLGGLSINFFVIEDSVLPLPARFSDSLTRLGAQLTLGHESFAAEWVRLRAVVPVVAGRPWRRNWALAPAERLRVRCMIDAIVAVAYDLDGEDLRWVLRDCDRPSAELVAPDAARRYDARGFWRSDAEREPELRHSVLTIAAFEDLRRAIASIRSVESGVAAFCAQNDGDGWMLPAELRLADLGLGHDDRAREPQRVRERLGPRFLPSQTEASIETSWAECEQHARNILGDVGFAALQGELAQAVLTPVRREQPKQVAEGDEFKLRGDPEQGRLF